MNDKTVSKNIQFLILSSLTLLLAATGLATVNFDGVTFGQSNDISYEFDGNEDFAFGNMTVYSNNLTGSESLIAATAEDPVKISISNFDPNNERLMTFSPDQQTDFFNLKVGEASGTYSLNQTFTDTSETLETTSSSEGVIDFSPQSLEPPADYDVVQGVFDQDDELFISEASPDDTNIDDDNPQVEFIIGSTTISGEVPWTVEVEDQERSGTSSIGDSQTVFFNEDTIESDRSYTYNITVGEGETEVKESFEFTTIKVNLEWERDPDDINGFRVYSNSTGTLSKVEELPVDEQMDEYEIELIEETYSFGDTISYAVTAYNEAGESTQTTETIALKN